MGYNEPDEPCLCGELASGSAWDWDGWRALVNVARYRTAAWLLRLGDYLISGAGYYGYWRLR